VKSFAPVVLAATSSVAVIVNPQVPAKSLREFIDLAKRDQEDALLVAGQRRPAASRMELLKLEARHRPGPRALQGAGGALTDLIGGTCRR